MTSPGSPDAWISWRGVTMFLAGALVTNIGWFVLDVMQTRGMDRTEVANLWAAISDLRVDVAALRVETVK